jgi:hypothetical protein
MSDIFAIPGKFEMLSVETYSLGFDFTNRLGGQSFGTAVASALVDRTGGTAFVAGLSGAPSVSGGTALLQTVTALAGWPRLPAHYLGHRDRQQGAGHRARHRLPWLTASRLHGTVYTARSNQIVESSTTCASDFCTISGSPNVLAGPRG